MESTNITNAKTYLTKKSIAFVAGVATLTIASLAMALPNAEAQSSGRDCDNNAVIRCGVGSGSEANSKYDAKADVRAIFNYFGISGSEMNEMHSAAKRGYVTKDGRVVVDGKTVATGAVTVGRQNMPGSKAVKAGGKTFYTRAPKVSFRQDKLDALVVMKNGRFQHAVIKSCGNPVKANPTTPEKKPEQPKPVTPTKPKTPTPPAPVTPKQDCKQCEQPAPVQPAPEQPAPVQPAPEQPAPVQPQGKGGEAPILPETGMGTAEIAGASAAITVASAIGYGGYIRFKDEYLFWLSK